MNLAPGFFVGVKRRASGFQGPTTMQTSLILAAGLLMAAPTLAQAQTNAQTRYGRLICNPSSWNPQCGRPAQADPYAVYSYDGRLIGRDPDPNIRMRLRDEDAYFRNR
jgi:hypothetical protein